MCMYVYVYICIYIYICTYIYIYIYTYLIVQNVGILKRKISNTLRYTEMTLNLIKVIKITIYNTKHTYNTN